MYVEAAIGDSFGCGVEARPEEEVQKHLQEMIYRSHPKWTEMTPGKYSDDTQMAIALGEYALSGKPLTLLNWASAVVDTFNRDPRPGYSAGFYSILRASKTGVDLLELVEPHSRKNGGAMRAWPLGLLADPLLVIDRAMFQAALTHATQDGQLAAAASALMTHYFYHDVGPKADVGLWIARTLGSPVAWLSGLWTGRVGFDNGKDTIAAAVTVVQMKASMTDILKMSVGFGGDTDTTATIAMAAASFSKEVAQDLPRALYDGLEDEAYGLHYLERLDLALRRGFPTTGVNSLPPEPVGVETEDGILDLFVSPGR